MTNEEAINVLEDYDINFERHTAEAIAEAHEMAIKALEEQTSEDCISRKSMLEGLANIAKAKAKSDAQKSLMGRVMFFTEHLPSVIPQPKEEPQPKTGHWEWVQYDANPNIGNWHCSECRCILRGEIKENPIKLPKYCPECGARMEEAKE